MLQKKTKLMLMKTRVMIVMQRRSMAISRLNCLRKRKKLKLIQKLLRIQRHKKKNLSLILILLCLMRQSMTMKQM